MKLSSFTSGMVSIGRVKTYHGKKGGGTYPSQARGTYPGRGVPTLTGGYPG